MNAILGLFVLCALRGVGAQACGKSNLAAPSFLANYIVGGVHALTGNFPWQVSLHSSTTSGPFCGGTFVSGKDGLAYVVTAAHCVADVKNVNDYPVVKFGMLNVTSSSTSDGVYIETPSAVTLHASYNTRTLSNDIAVMAFGTTTVDKIATDTSNGAAPACYPTATYKAGVEASVVSGWGTTSEGGSVQNRMRYVVKPIVDYNDCNTAPSLNAGELDSTMMCAGGTGKDACQGDSGGPLVVKRGDSWQLVGVVSWGYGCGRENAPGVYADAYYLRDWISTNVGFTSK